MELLNQRFDKLYPDKEESAILAINLNSPASRCLSKLDEHKVFCFPVMNPDHGDRVVGLLDRVDVCAYAIHMWDELGSEPEKFDEVFASTLESKTAEAVMNFSKMNDCYTLGEHATFKDVLKVLSHTGTRRVPMLARGGILDRKAKRPLARFITQTDVIRFVATNLDLFEDVLDVPIAGSLGTFPAHCVLASSHTIDAFKEMLDRRVSALGVVDDNHVLVGNISIRDIVVPLTSGRAAEILKGTVADFLVHIRAAGAPRAPITVFMGDSVHHVITLLNSNSVHRAYIIGEGGRPSGIITLSDICRFLLTHPVTVHKKESFAAHKEVKEEHPSKKDVNHLKGLVEKALESDSDHGRVETKEEVKEEAKVKEEGAAKV